MLKIFMVCLNYDDYLRITLPRNIKSAEGLAEFVVITDRYDRRTIDVAKENGALVMISHRMHQDGAPIAKGKAINDAMELFKPDGWVLVTDADVLFLPGFAKRLLETALDKDSLYYTRRWGPSDIKGIGPLIKDFDNGCDAQDLFKHARGEHAAETWRDGNAIEARPFGYFQLFHKDAHSLKGRAKIYEERYRTAEMDDHIFGSFVFSSENRVRLPSLEFDVIHLPHGAYTKNWSGRISERIPEDLK